MQQRPAPSCGTAERAGQVTFSFLGPKRGFRGGLGSDREACSDMEEMLKSLERDTFPGFDEWFLDQHILSPSVRPGQVFVGRRSGSAVAVRGPKRKEEDWVILWAVFRLH